MTHNNTEIWIRKIPSTVKSFKLTDIGQLFQTYAFYSFGDIIFTLDLSQSGMCVSLSVSSVYCL